MALIPQSALNAAEIDRINSEMVSLVRHQLARSYALVMVDPQAVLNALGPEAKTALIRYATLHSALSELGEADGLANPNFEIFQPQDDGRVIYIAPPDPVIEEPIPDPSPEESQ